MIFFLSFWLRLTHRGFQVPTESHDFKEGLLESDDGKKAVVQIGHEVS